MTAVSNPTPRRGLLAIGYQGFGNVGDESILTGIDAMLAGSTVTVDAVVCGPSPESVAAFPRARRIRSPRLLPTMAGIRALQRSSGLVLSGGGLIHDHWVSVIPRFLAWIVLARLLGRPVIWLGVGVGPLRRRTHRLLAQLALRLTAVAMVRDEPSADLLGGIGARVSVVPDPSVFNEPPAGNGPRTDAVAIIVRGPTPRDRDRAASLAAAFVDLVPAVRERGWVPIFMTMAGGADDAFVTLLRETGTARGVAVDVEALGPTPGAALATLASVRGVVTVRLHGLLLAAVAGVPAVAVAYDAKVRSAAIGLGLGDLVVELSDVTAGRLVEGLVAADLAERRMSLSAAVTRMRERRPEIVRRTDAVVGSGK